MRLRGKGSDGGHNGLKNINEMLGSSDYARLRFGIGGDFARGGQIDYVLGEWTSGEREALPERLKLAGQAVEAFVCRGLQSAMNEFNNK